MFAHSSGKSIPYSGKVCQGECLQIYSFQAFSEKKFGK